jgi:hypothetical protein
MSLQVDQNIDPVLVHPFDDLGDTQRFHILENIDCLFDALTHRLSSTFTIRISQNLETFAIMLLDRINDRVGDRMLLEITGKVSDPEPMRKGTASFGEASLSGSSERIGLETYPSHPAAGTALLLAGGGRDG